MFCRGKRPCWSRASSGWPLTRIGRFAKTLSGYRNIDQALSGLHRILSINSALNETNEPLLASLLHKVHKSIFINSLTRNNLFCFFSWLVFSHRSQPKFQSLGMKWFTFSQETRYGRTSGLSIFMWGFSWLDFHLMLRTKKTSWLGVNMLGPN